MANKASALFHCEISLKYKEPGCLTTSCVIKQYNIEKALPDLWVSIDLLSYSVYKQLGIGKFKCIPITIPLLDRS